MNIPGIILNIASHIKTVRTKYQTLPRALLVGGFVRDYLLDIESKDIDVEVYGVDYADTKKLLNRLFPGQVDEKGEAFGVMTIQSQDFSIDVALPREEIKIGRGYYAFKVKTNPNLSIKKAASRRDFTINALLLDPLTKKIIDPFKGRSDLDKKILRAVNPKTFGEDPLRIYRGIQFAGRFNLKVDSETFKLMKNVADSGELKTLSKKRINAELKKLDKSTYKARGLALAKQLGIIIN